MDMRNLTVSEYDWNEDKSLFESKYINKEKI